MLKENFQSVFPILQPSRFLLFGTIISNLHLLCIPIYFASKTVQSSSFHEPLKIYFSGLTESILIAPTLYEDYPAIKTFVFSLAIATTLFLLLATIIRLWLGKHIKPRMQNLFPVIIYLFQHVLYLPLLMGMLNFDRNGSKTSYIFIIQIICATLMGLMALIASILNAEIIPGSKASLLTSSNHSLIDSMIKTAYSISSVIEPIPSNTLKWVLSVIYLVLYALRTITILTSTPYLSLVKNKIYLVMSSIGMTICLENLIFCSDTQNRYINTHFLWMILAPLLTKILLLKFENSVRDSFSSGWKLGWTRSPFKSLLYLNYVLDRGAIIPGDVPNTQEKTIFATFINTHNSSCKNMDCICHYYQDKPINTLPQKSPKDLQMMFRDFISSTKKQFFLETLEQRFRQRDWMKIAYVQHILESSPEKYIIAIPLLQDLLSKDDFLVRILAKALMQKIESQIFEESKASADQVNFIQFIHTKKDQDHFRALVETSINQVIKFWAVFSETNPMIMDLCSMSKKFNQIDHKLEKVWQNIQTRSKTVMGHEYLLYANYCRLIKGSESKTQETLKIYYNSLLC